MQFRRAYACGPLRLLECEDIFEKANFAIQISDRDGDAGDFANLRIRRESDEKEKKRFFHKRLIDSARRVRRLSVCWMKPVICTDSATSRRISLLRGRPSAAVRRRQDVSPSA